MYELHFVIINQELLINKAHFFHPDDSGYYPKDSVLVILIKKPEFAGKESAQIVAFHPSFTHPPCTPILPPSQ